MALIKLMTLVGDVIAYPTWALLVAFAVAAVSDHPTAFSTVSNGSFMAVAFAVRHDDDACTAVPYVATHGAPACTRFSSAASLLLSLMGAASWAFHADPLIGTPTHALDIALAWSLLFYTCCLSLHTALQIGCRRTSRRVQPRALLLALFTAANTGAWTWYEEFKDEQMHAYLILVGVSMICAAGAHLAAARELGVHMHAVQTAGEIAAVIVTALVATYMQCELVGRACSAPEYELYHGLWHYFLATAVGLLYARSFTTLHSVQTGVAPSTRGDALSEWTLLACAAGAALLKYRGTPVPRARFAIAALASTATVARSVTRRRR